MELVSVVIPTYNREREIQRAIQSVLQQTYRNIDIIIVDDGSTDNTSQVVRSIPDKRITYIKCEANLGPGAARNLGIRRSKGEYVAFLDSDDEWLPAKLQKQIALMNNLSDSFGLCHTGAVLVKDGSIRTILKPTSQSGCSVYKSFVLGKISFVTPSLLFRRSCIDKIGMFDSKLWQTEDIDLVLRALKDHYLAVIEEPLVVCYLDTTKVTEPKKLEQAQLLFLKKHEHDVRQLGWYVLRRFRARRFWNIADNKLRAGHFKVGVGYLINALREDPVVFPKYAIVAFCVVTGLLSVLKQVAGLTSRPRRTRETKCLAERQPHERRP